MPRCKGLTSKGEQCAREAQEGSSHCFQHQQKGRGSNNYRKTSKQQNGGLTMNDLGLGFLTADSAQTKRRTVQRGVDGSKRTTQRTQTRQATDGSRRTTQRTQTRQMAQPTQARRTVRKTETRRVEQRGGLDWNDFGLGFLSSTPTTTQTTTTRSTNMTPQMGGLGLNDIGLGFLTPTAARRTTK